MSRFKRAFDIAGAFAGLLVFAPVLAIVILAVLMDDGRPVFFRQQRVGWRRRPFSILKIRTMRGGVITRVGRVLRATGLDELPQFVNILRGDMSAVGPRPLTDGDVQGYGWTGPSRFSMGDAARLDRGRADCRLAIDAGRAQLDRLYGTQWSPALDCQLIALSFAVNAFGKSRVQRCGSGDRHDSCRVDLLSRAADVCNELLTVTPRRPPWGLW